MKKLVSGLMLPHAAGIEGGDNILIIIVEREKISSFGGGDVHIETLTTLYRETFGIEVTKFKIPFNSTKFNAFSNIISLIKVLTWKAQGKCKGSHNGALVIAPSAYPNYVIMALKISKAVNGYPVVYFHHLSLSLQFIARRGILRTLINYCLTLFNLSICKILEVPIFLDNPDSYKIKGWNIFKDEDAPDPVIKSKYPLVKKDFDLCYIGRFQKHKGALDLIKVVMVLKRNNVNAKVAIVGHIDGRFKNKVLKILNTNKLYENFTFFGTVDSQTKFNILNSSRIYIHLSYEEGWGMSVMDAAAVGVPVVAYNLPAYSYLKGKFNSANVGDINQVVKLIVKMLSNYSDAVSIAKEAKKIVEAYNYINIAKYQIESYERIISKGATSYSEKNNG